uniref:Phosphoglucomutase n=1 Tax=Bursaphelenchus xylophilus TaxID=6326 RepID=A0A1I7SHH1_BURXY
LQVLQAKNMTSHPADLESAINKYLDWEKNPEALKEAREFISTESEAVLRKYFLGDPLAFGTAGVRCRMAPGFSALNHLTVVQLSHGMAQYIKLHGKNKPNFSVVIGYDGRFRSADFAKDAASVFLRNGIKVHLFTKVVPTPVTSFATPFLNCDAGLMITASHNPKPDNGYKAYWANGAQIVSPIDTDICKIAFDGQPPNPDYFDWSITSQVENADWVLEEYIKSEGKLAKYPQNNGQTPLKFTYSAFHGVGYESAMKMFKAFGFPDSAIFSVKEQQEPDPTFRTVPNPNPEEGLRVLKLCLEEADRNGSQVLLVNDPDADRIQVAEKQEDGSWRAFTGNEMGVILTEWTWRHWSAENPTANFSDVYVLNSAVSSQFAKTMASKEGFKQDVALTGFKWIGNLADKKRKEGKTVILGWEESIGYMPGCTLDKDGVSVAAIFAEIANDLWTKRKTRLSDELFELFKKYGYHVTRNSYWIVPEKSVTAKIFETVSYNPPATINGVKVVDVRDLTVYNTTKGAVCGGRVV